MDTEKNTKIGVNGKATEEQIAVWKKTYKDVYQIKVGEHYCYIRDFDRETMKYALSQLNMKVNTEKKEAEIDMEKIVNIGEIALQNCWLGGDEEIKNNARLWVSASMQAGELFNVEETELKKL